MLRRNLPMHGQPEENARLVPEMDNAAARALAVRRGVTGQPRHLDGRLLWFQQAVEEKAVNVLPVAGTYNIGDIATKALGAVCLRALLYMM